MEILRNYRKLSLAALLCAGALTLSACDEENYDGAGNEFALRGQVVNVGKHSVKLRVDQVFAADGRAAEWFTDEGIHQIHDNFRKCDGLKPQVVGQEVNARGLEETLADVHVGDIVNVAGSIRDSDTECGQQSDFERRPVFDRLSEVPTAS